MMYFSVFCYFSMLLWSFCDVSYDDVVDAVVYSSPVDLLMVHLDVVVHDDQPVDDEVLMRLLNVNTFDVCLLLYLFDAAGVDLVFSSRMSLTFFVLFLSCLLIMLMLRMLVASRCLMELRAVWSLRMMFWLALDLDVFLLSDVSVSHLSVVDVVFVIEDVEDDDVVIDVT